MNQKTTWDGKPVSEDPPYGATIIVKRKGVPGSEYLLLHRPHAKEPDGDWAWTPPSGARYPGEDIHACAARELEEETGLRKRPTLTPYGTGEWLVFLTEIDPGAEITLSPEHDQFKWVSLEEAIALCKPDQVTEPFRRLAEIRKNGGRGGAAAPTPIFPRIF